MEGLESISFESESRLTRIEGWCFAHCSLKTLCIPRNVEVIQRVCFEGSKLEILEFESESQLREIEVNFCSGRPIIRCIDLLPGVDQEAIEAFWRVKKLIAKSFPDTPVRIRADVGNGETEIPVELKTLIPGQLRLYTASMSLTLPDWIEEISANDFRFCSELREVVVSKNSALRGIHGFRNCAFLESIEIRSAIEIIGCNAFTHSEDYFGAPRIRPPIFIVVDEPFLRCNRRRCHLLNEGAMHARTGRYDWWPPDPFFPAVGPYSGGLSFD
jgi:hypothetical protein